jgi:hypothetical protein
VCFKNGCKNQSASPKFVDGTLIIAESVMTITRVQVLTNKSLFLSLRGKYISAGYAGYDIFDGSEITVFTYYYGWNSGVAICAHHGHYLTHVTVELEGKLKSSIDSTSDTLGELV